MNRLVINTATDELFIALQKGGEVFSHSINSVKHHNETMLTEIDALLKSCDLNLEDIAELGVVIGPGSFTGIRVGIATIKAFRDALNIRAKGINCLDYLYALANGDAQIAAMAGSQNSYFVAEKIHDEVFKFERNLTLNELKERAGNRPIAMFNADANLNSFVVKQDASVLLNCLTNSTDEILMPVYYQLSQAENEKNKRAAMIVRPMQIEDLNAVAKIEQENILCNTISQNQLKDNFLSDAYKVFVACIENEVVGFILLQKTDELNIDSIAVKKEFRNRGVGTSLIDTAKNFAQENDIGTLSLEVGYKNIAAFVLYEKLGFHIRRVRKKYYQNGDDAIEMVMRI